MALRRVFACFLLLAACADTRPPATESATTTAAASTEPADDDSDEAPMIAAQACVPGASHECKIFWRSLENDVQHCLTASQVCTADGKGWTACGDVDGGAPAVIE